MIRPRASIRMRLLLSVMAVLIILSSAMAWEVYDNAKRTTDEAFDRVLLGSALAIADRVVIVDNQVRVDVPFVALEMLSATAQDRVFYRVSAANGRTVTGYEDLPVPAQPVVTQRNQPHFYTTEYKGETIRVGMVSRYVSSPTYATRFSVMVAETTQTRESLVNGVLRGVVIRQGVLVLGIAAILWFGIHWGLRPLERLKRALLRRNPNDLHPISHDVPQEIYPLVEGINDLMLRLANSFASMRRFTGNAAHQLRTPLAAIQTQTALALKSNDTAALREHLNFLDQSTRQSTRLINQMLRLAQLGDQNSEKMGKEIDLEALCQAITADFVPQALALNIDLGYERVGDTGAMIVRGAEGLLSEALRNLIQNALLYCPAYSEVTVRLSQTVDHTVISVIDTGQGIAPEFHDRLFERFDRAGRSDGDGCGLGLPIVKEIMERHGGTITLHSEKGQGACFEMRLPL